MYKQTIPRISERAIFAGDLHGERQLWQGVVSINRTKDRLSNQPVAKERAREAAHH